MSAPIIFNPAVYRDFLKRKLFGSRETYSQNGEDLILSLFLRNQESGFYVDVGANHPKIFNNTYLFYQWGWRGINIEPNPQRHRLFEKIRPHDINLNCGVGETKTELDFYLFQPDALSTFSPTTAKSYEQMGHQLVEVRKVKIQPLSEILKERGVGQEIDFLSIDTEGFDRAVLKSNDWKKFRPKFIILETLEYQKHGFGPKLNKLYDSYLSKLGYEKVADTFINTIYAEESAAKRLQLQPFAPLRKTVPARKKADAPRPSAMDLSAYLARRPLKLHLGCGERYLSGHVNIDYPPSEHTVMAPQADLYADVRTLEFPANSVDEVRMHHLFEHFSRTEALRQLLRWRRWLKPDGLLVIETPDFEASVRSYLRAFRRRRKMQLGRHIFGSQEAKWAFHLDFWDKEKFSFVLTNFGFKDLAIKRYQNRLAQHFPKIPFLNLLGNLLPDAFYSKYGGSKLPSIVVFAKKDGAALPDGKEEEMIRKILSHYLVGREGEELLDVWLREK